MNSTVVGRLVAIIVIASAALGVKLAVDAQRPQGTDSEQLQAMLFQGEKAAKRKDAPGITRYISRDYSDSLGMTDTSLKYEIGRFLNRRANFDISVPSER